MATKLILLFAVLALASVGVLAGPLDEQRATSCSRFRTDVLEYQIKACARFITPSPWKRGGSYCAHQVPQYLEEHNDCSTATITENLTQCLLDNYVYSDESQKTVNCVELSITSGVCCYK
ncbi:30S ribosomal protein S7 [Frankliniella fusca]|uniref:30S ribosomal protein S7 n=1 Tax=Frankliniella fusca TaxID=407009 RepID=A0AAE1LV28_9NEOP|nr:30S ribosomal protein S7 [Frankliniella fusca]KAK3932780.1 30S ribosomal protein S7 [Frankliniella fusca]